jgi:uncharacterized protein (TIGR00369 family)
MPTTDVNAGGHRRGPFWDLIGGHRDPPPAATLLGWEVEAVDPEAGTIELSFTAKEDFLNLAGNVQGGFLAAMLDATLGPVLGATLSDGEWAPTISLNVQFVRPAKPGKLRGRGRIVRRGRDIAFLAGELIDGDDIIATATASAIIRLRD